MIKNILPIIIGLTITLFFGFKFFAEEDGSDFVGYYLIALLCGFFYGCNAVDKLIKKINKK